MVSFYMINFIIFSFLGWIYECVYCAAKSKHWDNRGFLFGPICPIYGVGILAAMIVFMDSGLFNGRDTEWWKIYLLSAVGSAILEYSVSYILEKLFKAMWWDYSNVPFNINGRICLPATMGFGFAGVLCVKWIIPFISSYTIKLEAYALINESVGLMLALVLGMDIALTIASLTSLLVTMNVLQERFDERMERSVEKVTKTSELIREKIEGTPQMVKERTLVLAKHQLQQIGKIRTIRVKGYMNVWERLKREAEKRNHRE